MSFIKDKREIEYRMASPLVAQRLWLLQRPAACGSMTAGSGMDFAGAIAVLDGTTVYVVVIISDAADRAGEYGLSECGDRGRLERNAFKFSSLDEALDGVGRIRKRFIARGWRDHEHEMLHADIDSQKETP